MQEADELRGCLPVKHRYFRILCHGMAHYPCPIHAPNVTPSNGARCVASAW